MRLASARRRSGRRRRSGGARGGLASHGVAPAVLSGAALGHDRVRDGTGWGQRALGHGHPRPPRRAAPARRAAARSGRLRPHAAGRRRCVDARRLTRLAACTNRSHSHERRAPHAHGIPCRAWVLPGLRGAPAVPAADFQPESGRPFGYGGSALGHEHGSAPVGYPPSTCRLATRSSAGGLTSFESGEARLGAGFPLRCFQRFARPDVATQRCRLPDNWPTSGASSPVLSY